MDGLKADLVPHLVSRFWHQELCDILLQLSCYRKVGRAWAGGALNEGSLWVFWRTSSWRLFWKESTKASGSFRRLPQWPRGRHWQAALFPKIMAIYPGFLPLSLPIPEALIVEMERNCEGTSWEEEWGLKNELDGVLITGSNPASLRAAWVIVKRQERKTERCEAEANDWKK